MNLTLVSAAVAFAMGFGGAWKVQSMRIDHADKQRSEIALEAERFVSRQESARSAQSIVASNNARLRESKLRADSAAASRSVVGLRSALATTVQAARADPASCVERTATASELFAQCGEALGSMAQRCDRHTSDLRLMIEAWPK